MTPKSLSAALAPEAQAARQTAYMTECRAVSFPRFCPDGAWVGPGGARQSGPLAIAWYAGGEVIREGITALRTCALISEYFSPVEEVWIGDQLCPDLTGLGTAEDWVFVKDGITCVALRSLALTDHGREKTVSVTSVGKARVVSFYNYEGLPGDFLGAEIRRTCGGLVYLMGSEGEYGSFAAFCAACATLQVTDCTYEGERRVTAQWGDHSVDVLWDMQSEGLFRAQRNGKFIGEPYLEYGTL